MKKRIIFDVDGTLIPKMDFRDSVIKAFVESNISYDDEIIDLFIEGMSDYEKYFNRYTIYNYYNHLYNKTNGAINYDLILNYLNNSYRLVPQKIDENIYDVLDYLFNKYDLIVFSNFFKEVQEKRLEQFELLKYFSEVIGGDLFIKPDEKAFISAKGKYNFEDCVYIGDNIDVDILGAYNAGMDSILINNNNEEENIKILKRML